MTDIEVLMLDGCTKKEAEAHLLRGSSVIKGFEEFFDDYMQQWGIDEEEVPVYKKMIEDKTPAPDWGVVEKDGETYYIMYCL